VLATCDIRSQKTTNFSGRVGRQRGALLPFSVGPSPNLCMHLSAHTALQFLVAP